MGILPRRRIRGQTKAISSMARPAGQFLFIMRLEYPRGTRYPNHLLHKQVLQRELYAALRGYLRRNIIPSKMGDLMLITPDRFHIHQWHTLSMEDTSPPQQLSNSIMENHISWEEYLPRYLRQSLQLALQSVQGGRSPAVHAMCPTPMQQKWAWTTRCVVSWRKRLVRLRL